MTMHDTQAHRSDDAIRDMLARARPDQIRRLLNDILKSPAQRDRREDQQ